jgi:hypothetical protein
MYTVVEIDKTSLFTGTFTPYTPFVYSSIVSGVVASYWTDTFGADGTYPTTILNITSVMLSYTLQVEVVDSIADCVNQENSFYFDYDTQTLYIHYPHDWTPDSVVELTGIAYGFTSDTVRYFRNQLYRPLIKGIPSLSDQADPLQYGIMSFGGGTVSLVNNNGLFDVDEKLYGNILRIKMGEEGDTYDDLILMFTGYIRDYTLTTSEFNVEVADKRERLQVETPSKEFTVLDAYDTTDGWETRSELLPDGYGDVIQVPAFPIADNSGTVTFRWAEVATSISQVYTYDDVLTQVIHAAFSTSGTFTLADAQCAKDGSDPHNGLKAVYVTGRMRNLSNPGDIIADLNERVNGIAYNDSNYNTTEWEAEKAYLDDVYLYMDEAKKVYEWIELIQNGCNWGFRYEDLERIALRRDDPSRSVSATITAIDIRNSDMPVLRNAELYASSCKVKYAKNHRTGRYQYTENTNYKSDVINEHHIEKVQQYESILTSQTDAEEKALRVMQDISVVRPIVTLRVDAKTYPTPRIYDMVSATVSLLTQGDIIPSLCTYLLGDTIGALGDSDGVIGEVYDETFTEAYSYDDNVREYFGTLTGQVIGIQWLPDSNEIELRLRSR